MIKPLRDRIIVARSEVKEKTSGGIIITGEKEKPCEGTILEVGSGYRFDDKIVPLEVMIGDVVLFGKYTGQEVEYQGETVLVMREEDVLGIISRRVQ